MPSLSIKLSTSRSSEVSADVEAPPVEARAAREFAKTSSSDFFS